MPTKKDILEAVKVLIDHLGPGARIFGQGLLVPEEIVQEATKVERGPSPSELMGLWNDLRDPRLPECKLLTNKRIQYARARLKQVPDRQTWVDFIAAINNNDWLLGVSPSVNYPDWKASFDWFIRPGSVVRFLEGAFKQRTPRKENFRDKYAEDLDKRSR